MSSTATGPGKRWADSDRDRAASRRDDVFADLSGATIPTQPKQIADRMSGSARRLVSAQLSSCCVPLSP
jgi:hypothetical protein